MSCRYRYIFGDIKGEIIAMDFKAYSRLKPNTSPSDPDAALGIDSQGRVIFGYKLHLTCDAKAKIPLSYEVTAANVHDTTMFKWLVEDAKHKGFRLRRITADAGYDRKEK